MTPVLGAVALDVKPDRADVWADGEYVGEARDLDGRPSLLWLREGSRTIAVYDDRSRTFEETLAVERGTQTKPKVRLEMDQPPGTSGGRTTPGRMVKACAP